MKIVVIGGGGHAYVVIDILQVMNEHNIVGLLDPNLQPQSTILGIPVLGDDNLLAQLKLEGVEGAIVAVGGNPLRRKIYEKILALGFVPINAIHPTAIISSHVTLGQGIAIMPGAVINVYSTIGDNTIINTGASLDHHNKIGSHVHIAPGCHLAGNVQVGELSFLGIGTSVIDGITIGSHVTTGGGTSVYRNVADNKKVVSAPMRYLE